MKKVKQIVKQNGKPRRLKVGIMANLKLKSGIPGAIRTLDPLLRRQLLYPTELQDHPYEI